MAERINLAQFDIDTRLLEDKIAGNKTQIDLLKGEITETRKVLKDYQDQAKLAAGIIVANNRIQEQANEELRQGIISQEQYNEVISDTSQVIRQNEVELARLLEAERDQQRQLTQYENNVRSLNDENRELNTLLRGGRTEVAQNEGAYTALSHQLSAARTEANNLGAQLRELEQNGQRNTQEYIRLNREWQQASTRARELHDDLLALDRATGDNRRNVGNYADSIRDAFGSLGTGFAQLMSGNITGGLETLKEGFKGVTESVRGLWTAILTNPLTALAAALAAIVVGFVAGVKAVFDYNQEINKLNTEIEQLTNLTGTVVDRLREYSKAIEETFGRDFQDNVKELNSLMKDFGLTSKEAYDLYIQGLTKGGAMNSEFGDSIREYGALFAQNGYSAEEFLNLLNSGIDLDIYSDKLPDAIKEAGLALNEQTKATRDALINAFGQPFSDDLLKRIRNGSTTVKQAIDEIASQAQKVGLNTQQIAQLNADVFKGAGEDAGGLVKIIEAVNRANDVNLQKLTESQQATVNLADANTALEKAKTDAFKSEGITAFTKNIELGWVKVKTVFFEMVGSFMDVVSWLDKVTGTSNILNQVWDEVTKFGKSLYNSFTSVKGALTDLFTALGLNTEGTNKWLGTLLQLMNPLNLVKAAVSITTATIRAFSSTVEASRVIITTFALSAKNLFGQVISVAQSLMSLDFKGALEKLKDISVTKEIQNAYKEAQKIVALNRQAKQEAAEEIVIGGTKIKGNDKDTGSSADASAKAEKERHKLLAKQLKEQERLKKQAEKEQEQATKQDLANAKERANVAIQATQAELANYIAMNAEKLKSDKRLTQQRLNEIKKYLEDVREKTQIANELEKQQKLQSLNDQIAAIKGASQQELDQKKNLVAQKEVVEKEYATREILINNESNDKINEADKSFLTQKQEQEDLYQALGFQQRILNLQKQHADEWQVQKVLEEQRFQEELTEWARQNKIKLDLDNDKYISDQEIQLERDDLQNQYDLAKDEAEKLRIQNQLNALDYMVSKSAKNQENIEKAKENAKLQAISNTLGQAAGLFAENTAAYKTLSIAQAAINTYLGVSGVLAQYPGPIGWGMSAVQIALGLAQVAKIAGIGVEKSKVGGYIDGGLINGGFEISRSNGDNRLITAKDGEVILNENHQALLGGASTFKAIGVPGFAAGGIVGGVSSLQSVQNNIKENFDMNLMSEMITSAVLEGALIGTQNGSQQGIIKLSENRQIQNGANF